MAQLPSLLNIVSLLSISQTPADALTAGTECSQAPNGWQEAVALEERDKVQGLLLQWRRCVVTVVTEKRGIKNVARRGGHKADKSEEMQEPEL